MQGSHWLMSELFTRGADHNVRCESTSGGKDQREKKKKRLADSLYVLHV